jgi:hypothetical protein
VFRSPRDASGSVNAAYFGVTSLDVQKPPRTSEIALTGSDSESLEDNIVMGDPSTFFEATDESTTGEVANDEVMDSTETDEPKGTTVFWNEGGASFKNMCDGTSNTIAIVEAKREIPWTQPVDIEYSVEKPLPKFGGWFAKGWHAGFANGSVKYLSHDNDERTVRNLLTIADGQPGAPPPALVPNSASSAVQSLGPRTLTLEDAFKEQLGDEAGSFVTVPLRVDWHPEVEMKRMLGREHLTVLGDGTVVDDSPAKAIRPIQYAVLHGCRLASYGKTTHDGTEYWTARLFVPLKPVYSIGSLWFKDPVRTMWLGDRHTPVPSPSLTQDDPQDKIDEVLAYHHSLRLEGFRDNLHTSKFPDESPLPVEQEKTSPAMEMQNRLQGNWDVLVFDREDVEGPDQQDYQVTIREDVLHLQTVVNGKVTGIGPCKLIWPDSNVAKEIDCVWEPHYESKPFPALIACDGNTLQIAMRVEEIDDRNERPSVVASGDGIWYLDCKRAAPPIGQVSPDEAQSAVSPVIGQWSTKLYMAGGETEIANGRLLDPDRELAALEETIPREELLAGPWVLEVSPQGSLVLQHATARLPLMSLDIGSIKTETFDVRFPKHILESPLAKFSPGLAEVQLRARFQIDGSSLKLSISEIDDADATPPLSPTADMYFECERLAAATGVKDSTADAEHVRRLTQPQVATPTDSAPEVAPPDWSDFLKRLPEVGTVLVMFDDDSDISKQMGPVARSVAEAASIKLIELPQFEWRRITAPPATHFVLMKDRQLVGTRTGLLTEKRLTEFVALAEHWLTPHSTGVDPQSLVRIDCYISPGTNNIGSQHGAAYPLTTAVVAVHEDQALLLGPDSIAEYMDKGYACVAMVRDEAGKTKQVPLDVVQVGPVKLIGQDEREPVPVATATITLGNGQTHEIPIDVKGYPESVTRKLDAYDTGSAIYHIRGAHGLSTVKLAPVDYLPEIKETVLSGGFNRERNRPPIFYFASPIDWQSQTVDKVGSSGYGGNVNGPELIDVLCPSLPTPCGFTFNRQGQLIGRYALGHPTEDDMTHTIFQPDTTHSILRAALMKIEDAELKSALEQTLEAKDEPVVIEPAVSIRHSMEHIINPAFDALHEAIQSRPIPKIEWDTIKGKALTLSEAGNLLRQRGAKDDQRWIAESDKLRNQSRMLFEATENRDLSAAMEHVNAINESCTNCHRLFRDRGFNASSSD